MIERCGRKPIAGRQGCSGPDRHILPGPGETVLHQTPKRRFSRKLPVIQRRIEIAANNPRNRSKLSVRGLHRVNMRAQLFHRFLTHRHILMDVATIAFEMQGINHQELSRREFVGRKGKAAGRRHWSIRFPFLRPGAQGL